MNIIRSGKFPDKIKRFAALLAVLSITLSGCSCVPDKPSFPSDISSGTADTAETSDTADTSESSDSSDPYSTTHTPETSDSSSFVESSNGSEVSDSDPDSDSESGSQTESSDSSDPISSSESLELTSSTTTVQSTVQPPDSSSSQQSSSGKDPDPPPVVVVPTVAVPSSPGTLTSVGKNGSFDYSNASYGYISAVYTGSSKKVKLRIACGSNKYDHDLDPNGTTQYYSLPFGSGTYTVTLFEHISGQDYARVTQQSFTVDLVNSLSPFLYPNRYVNYNQNSALVYKSAEICAGKTKTIDKIAAIFQWVSSNISYDYELAATVQSGYVPDPDKTLSRRKGICFDYSSLMAAMLRAQSIPTRLVIGNASPDIYHAWNEVYTEETGWVTPELLLKKAGYNILDATFYSSAKDKAQIADYISNGGNYTVRYYY